MPKASGIAMRDIEIDYLLSTLVERFWPRVDGGPRDFDACWTWTGSTMTAPVYRDESYGELYFNRRKISAHRLSYLAFRGDLEPGQVIRHMCDNPRCVNPRHLEQGTYAQNAADYRQQTLHIDEAAERGAQDQDVLEMMQRDAQAWDDVWRMTLGGET